jgi:hypothetical protein
MGAKGLAWQVLDELWYVACQQTYCMELCELPRTAAQGTHACMLVRISRRCHIKA